LGAHQIANENMANAARVHSSERGKGPRRYPMFAFGGGGPVQAYRIAQSLGSPQLLAPLGDGVMSMVGFLSAPLAFDFVRSWHAELADLDWDGANQLIIEMEREGTELLVRSGVESQKIEHRRWVDTRFAGQGHEIRVVGLGLRRFRYSRPNDCTVIDWGAPGHINPMATGVIHSFNVYRLETLRPGDVLVTNDPWQTAGQINDFTVLTPVFRDDTIVGYFSNCCHSPDIGGRILSAEAQKFSKRGCKFRPRNCSTRDNPTKNSSKSFVPMCERRTKPSVTYTPRPRPMLWVSEACCK